jgi:hypothetical protein
VDQLLAENGPRQGSTYLTPEETQKVLKDIPYRLRKARRDGWGNCPIVLEVQYKGKWIVLGRTDLLDDVATSIYTTRREEYGPDPVERYRQATYGARISQWGFHVIDSMTDG